MGPIDARTISFSRLWGQASYPAGSSLGARKLDDFEFVLIDQGQVVWHTPAQDHVVQAGDLLLAAPGMIDAFTWDPSRTTWHSYVHFLVELDEPDRGVADAGPLRSQHPSSSLARQLMDRVVGLLDARGDGAEGSAAIYTAALLTCYLERNAGSPTDPELPRPVTEALAHVRRQWSGDTWHPTSMDQLARQAAVSPAHLSRVFSHSFGEPPMRLLRHVRLDRAAQMLIGTDLDVSDVARACGFAASSHFSRAFSKAYGLPPTEYRATDARPTGPTIPQPVRRTLSP